MKTEKQLNPPDSAKTQPEIKLIKQVLTDAARFQNQQDYEGFSRLFTRDSVIVNIKGVRIFGRNEFYKFMKAAMKSFLADITVANEVVDITFLRSDVAVISAVQHIVKKVNHEEENLKGSATFVMVKEQGKWSIALGQNTVVEE
jgi:uncharacterized protein (TIGR02246 family)